MRGAGGQVSGGREETGKGPVYRDLRGKSDSTLVEVAVHTQAVRHRAVQHFDLVGVLGREAGLQPVVGMQAPGCSCLAQLLESTQAAVGHTQAKGLAVWFKAHLPVVLATINQRVPCSPETGRGARCSVCTSCAIPLGQTSPPDKPASSCSSPAAHSFLVPYIFHPYPALCKTQL